MSGKQRAVLWIGLILITFNLIRRWKDISSVIFSGAGAPATSGGGSGSSSGNDGGNSVTIPIDPFLPTGPKITIPLPKF